VGDGVRLPGKHVWLVPEAARDVEHAAAGKVTVHLNLQ
jgi:hypothetical protein